MFQSSEKWALNSSDSELILSETALIFSVLDSAYSDKIRADQLWNSAIQRQLSLGFQLGQVCSEVQTWTLGIKM